MRVSLGKVYRDTVTGFVGTATARNESIDEHVLVSLQPDANLVTNVLPAKQWFGESRLELVEEQS